MSLLSVCGRAPAVIAAVACGVLLAACGGGGGGDAGAGGGGTGDGTPTLTTRASEGGVPGGVYTSKADSCELTQVSAYALKAEVHLNGGADRGGAAGLLPNTAYHVRVTTPSGNEVLGTSGSEQPVVTDATGKFRCLKLVDLVWRTDTTGAVTGVRGFRDTTNAAGEYKVWISTSTDFASAYAKSDSFKVTERDGSTTPTEPTGGTVHVKKFYDANANGQWDLGEPWLTNWSVTLTGVSGVRQTPTSYTGLPLAERVAGELRPVEANWYATNAYVGADPFVGTPPTTLSSNPLYLNQVAVAPTASNSVQTAYFGNVCVGAGGGRGLGYWANKNGEATMQSSGMDARLAGLRDLNLFDGDGVAFDPASYGDLSAWLLSGRATNMAYMLSVQMAAAWLNTTAGGVPSSSLVHAPGAIGANAAGFIALGSLIDEANDSLAANPVTRAGMPQRTYQELLKNALDASNNNQNFVQATPCGFSFDLSWLVP